MESQIYHLVNKLMEIFEVDQPVLGQQWAERLITSARRPDNSIKPINVSLDEIESYRGDSGIRDLYNEFKRHDGNIRGADGLLHLASRLGTDDSLRKFIKIHNLLRASKAKKIQQQTANATVSTATSTQAGTNYHHQNQTTNTSKHHHYHHLQQQQQHQPQAHPPQQSNGFQAIPMVQPNHLSSAKTARQIPLQDSPQNQASRNSQQSLLQHSQQTSAYETPRPANRQLQQHQPQNLSTSMIAITPAYYKTKRDKARRSEKEMRRKNDLLYQKMKAFLTENQFLSFDFKKIDWTQMTPIAPLSAMSVQEQESALINDLLYVLIGTEGKYIRMQPSRESPNKHTIGVERGGDELVYTSATRIIKICPLYSTVVHYAEDVNFGLVNQALAAPIRDLVKEYLSLISNLQMRALRDEMTLQSMWLSLQTIFYRMEALKQILDQISRDSCYGGHTLSVLHNRVVNFSTDPRTHEFCLKLMQAASEPYFEILERWLYLGVIEDPYGEFFIEDTENRDNRGLFSNNISNQRANNHQQTLDIDAFWRKRFTRDDSKVPDFLRSKQERIFDTGKYLSVVRQYGQKVFKPLRYEPLIYCPELRKYDEKVDEAYKFASKELLDLLLIENRLIDRLHSLKRYFLFSSGDFFVQFMDMADEELSKTKDDINMTRLESLLELALRTSSCNNDPYKDDVHIKMSDGSLYHIMASINNTNNFKFDDERSRSEYCHSSGNLLGWESLTLSYDVAWPLSMIICKDYCQTLYQMMFRHLFCCKYIERKLEATWRVNRLFRFNNYEGAFALRHKMLHFVHNLLYYIIEIIEPSFQILISKFKDGGIENVNEVIELHRAFLSGLVHDSMLTDNELLGHVTKLLLLCMDFSVVIEARFAAQELAAQQQQLENQSLISRSKSINNLTTTKSLNKENDTDAKSNKRPNVVVRAMTDSSSSAQGESYVASQIRKLSLTSQHNQQQNSRMQKSESIGNFKAKSTNPDDVFQIRIGEINEKFNSQLMILLNALTIRSQDFTASSKLQNIFYRLDFNNFYTKSDLAA